MNTNLRNKTPKQVDPYWVRFIPVPEGKHRVFVGLWKPSNPSWHAAWASKQLRQGHGNSGGLESNSCRTGRQLCEFVMGSGLTLLTRVERIDVANLLADKGHSRLAGEAVDVEDTEYRKPLDLVRRSNNRRDLRPPEQLTRCAGSMPATAGTSIRRSYAGTVNS